MRWDIKSKVEYNSFDYLQSTLITDNGFREYDVRWLLGKEVNPNGFVVLGRAYGTYARTRLKSNRVVVGHDFRSYSQELCRSFIVGLLSTGAHVIDIGLALTPMVYFAQYHFRAKAGAMLTASHNDNGWTGLKLACGFSSTLGPEGIAEFKALVKAGDFITGKGRYESSDEVFDAYSQDLMQFGTLSRPLKVVIAAGNGTAGRFAPSVLRAIGAEVSELDTNPDWNFPNFNPNPENMKFLHSISAKAVQENADLGIGIDGDGDRLGVVDNQGKEVFSDKLGLLFSRWISARFRRRKIVVDVKSTGLYFDDPVLRRSGTEVVMCKTGHSYIKAKVAETHAIAGFEKSGHAFFSKPLGRSYDDAILAGIQLLHMIDEARRPLSEIVGSLPQTWQSPTLSAYCPDGDKYRVVDIVTEQYRQDWEAGIVIGDAKIKELIVVNGVRFILEDGSWGLVRASSNQPSLVVVAESRRSEDQLYEIIRHIQGRLAATGQVGAYDQQMPARGAIK